MEIKQEEKGWFLEQEGREGGREGGRGEGVRRAQLKCRRVALQLPPQLLLQLKCHSATLLNKNICQDVSVSLWLRRYRAQAALEAAPGVIKEEIYNINQRQLVTWAGKGFRVQTYC